MQAALHIALTIAGICAPSLLIALAVRRWLVRVPWKIITLFLFLTFAFLGGAVFTTGIPVPLDEVARGYPHRGVTGEIAPRNPLTNDTVRLFLPWMHVVREELAAGNLPLWNRYAFSGYPLLGNGESAPFFPTFLATLFVPLPKQLVAMAGVKLFVSLLFTWLLIRRERLPSSAAVFAAVCFTFSVFQTVYLYYSTTAVTSLLPAAIFTVLHLFDNPRSRSAFWFCAIVVGVLQTAGHPESVLHVAVACVVLLLIEVVAPAVPREDSAVSLRSRLLLPAAAALFGMLISAPAWVPVLEQVTESLRFQEISEAREMTPPFPGAGAWTLLNPDLFGNPARGNWSWVLNYSVVASSYAGLLTLALIPSALFSRRASARDRILAIAAIASFLMAMNWTIIGRVLNAIPPLSIVANDKIRFVTVLLAAMIAARALTRIERGSRWLELAGSALVVLIAAEGLHRKLGITIAPPAFAGILTVAGFWLAAIYARRFGKMSLILPAAVAAITIELFVINIPFNALVDTRLYRPELPIINAIHERSPGEPFRVAGIGWVLMPQTSAEYGVEDIRGSDPMATSSYMNVFRLIEAEDDSFGVKRIENLAQPCVDFLNVRFALAEPGAIAPPGWRVVYQGVDGTLVENGFSMRRFYAPERLVPEESSLLTQLKGIEDFRTTAVIHGVETHANPPPHSLAITEPRSGKFRLRIDAKERTFIASSQPHSPGWRVGIDGERAKIHTVNGAFIGFFVPAGQHVVEVKYVPMSFWISVVVAVLALLGGVWWLRRNREPNVQRSDT